MKKLFLVFILLLISVPAFGHPTSYRHLEPEALAYNARVINDGGTVVDSFWLNVFIRTAKEYSAYSTFQFIGDPNWGYKNVGSGASSKWYDISGNNNDATQATGTRQPTWTPSSIGARPAFVLNNGAAQGFGIGALSAITTATCFFVVYYDSGSPSAHGTIISNSGRSVGIWLDSGSNGRIACNGDFEYSTVTHAQRSLFLLTASNGYLYFNGILDSSSAYTPSALTIVNIGTDAFGNNWDGNFGTFAIGTSVLNTQQQNAIQRVINSYYAIY